jgi:hypothetical protein
VIGNMFVLVIAGRQSTRLLVDPLIVSGSTDLKPTDKTSGNTIETALVALAAYPEVPQEIQKEIDEICATKAEDADFTYDDYPKMRVIVSLLVSLQTSSGPSMNKHEARNTPSLPTP